MQMQVAGRPVLGGVDEAGNTTAAGPELVPALSVATSAGLMLSCRVQSLQRAWAPLALTVPPQPALPDGRCQLNLLQATSTHLH